MQIHTVTEYLVGCNPLRRKQHWSELKRALRKYDRMGIGPLDIALWTTRGSSTKHRFTNYLGRIANDSPRTRRRTQMTGAADLILRRRR